MSSAIGRAFDRRARGGATPEYEDIGLFKGELCQLQVEMTPNVTKNGRSDIVVDGFISGSTAVKVVFAGRRGLLFGPLQSRLRGAKTKHTKKLKDEFGKDADLSFSLTDVRLPVLVEGSWRMQFELDSDGFQHRVSQFVAARWVFATDAGDLKTFGSPPAHTSGRV